MAVAARRIQVAAECLALLNTGLAVLTVVAVLAVRAVLKLLLLPFRILRGLFRRGARPARATAH